MTKIAIDGLGLVGAFGVGKEAFRAALQAGRVEPEWLPVDPDSDGVTMPVLKANPTGLDEFVSLRALRRIDYFSRLAILGAGLAMKDANLTEMDKAKLGIVIGTGYGATATTFGFMDSMLDFGDSCASPTKFSNSVHNAAAANAAIVLGIEGVNLTVSQFDMSVPVALHSAMEWLRSGVADAIILGGVEEYCKPLGYCYKRYFGVPDGTMTPLDFDRQTAIPGEGAAFLVLRRQEDTDQPLAVIDQKQLGFGADQLSLPDGGTLVLGADGHQQSAAHYRKMMNGHDEVRCFSPTYGSLPASPAFDMAAAALQMDELERAHCLRFNCRGDFACISMSKE